MLFQRLLTKKELCYIFGLRTKTGRCYYAKLRQKFMTDDVLAEIGLSPEEYDSKKMRQFDYQTTKRILERFNISPSERLP